MCSPPTVLTATYLQTIESTEFVKSCCHCSDPLQKKHPTTITANKLTIEARSHSILLAEAIPLNYPDCTTRMIAPSNDNKTTCVAIQFLCWNVILCTVDSCLSRKPWAPIGDAPYIYIMYTVHIYVYRYHRIEYWRTLEGWTIKFCGLCDLTANAAVTTRGQTFALMR